MSEEIVDRLDRIAALLALANSESIQLAAEELRQDELNRAILEACPDAWVPAGAIWSRVSGKTNASQRTFRRRLGELGSRGALHIQGRGAGTKYRLSGLV
jgi:hypothetical protein